MQKSNVNDNLGDSFVLPENCIAHVLSFTGPRDTCRLALVSSLFNSASDSDTVWKKFLPSDLDSFLLDSSISSLSKKELFFRLCESPILIDGDKSSIWLEKETGKKCYMLSAKALDVVWGDTPEYWTWEFDPDSRFGEVAELHSVCWLELRGKMSTSMLSPNTMYKAYLVYKITETSHGFNCIPVEVNVGVNGNDSDKSSVYLENFREISQGTARRRLLLPVPRRFNEFRTLSRPDKTTENDSTRFKERGDGWLEIEMGNFFNKCDEDGHLEMSVLEVKTGCWKGGLIVQGIEIRAMNGK